MHNLQVTFEDLKVTLSPKAIGFAYFADTTSTVSCRTIFYSD